MVAGPPHGLHVGFPPSSLPTESDFIQGGDMPGRKCTFPSLSATSRD